MPYSILEALGTARRPIDGAQHEALQQAALQAEQDAGFIDEDRSYAEVLRARALSQAELAEDGSLAITPFLGYAIGVRKGAFSPPEETGTLWNEISTYALGDFRQGLASGSHTAQKSPNLSPFQLIDTTLEFAEQGQIRVDSSADLLGRMAGTHAVELQRRVA